VDLVDARAVTIIEFGAEDCLPCRQMQADLVEMCQTYRRSPPRIPVRMYTIDVEDEANREIRKRYAPNSVPHLYVYAGTVARHHFDQGTATEILTRAVEETVRYVSMAPAARGALSGLTWGAIIGGVLGTAAGIALTAVAGLSGGLAALAILGLGAAGGALGLGIGAAIGAIAGALRGRPGGPVGAREADTLIRRRFGAYLSDRGPAALLDAPVRRVTQAELCARFSCRHAGETCSPNLVGWTDQGPESAGDGQPAEADPTCAGGQQLEHATPSRPVIYIASDRADAGVLVHEGLHAHSSQAFGQAYRNYVNEGTTEHFTRQILRDAGIPRSGSYDDQVGAIEQMVAVVGEEALRGAYFRGELKALEDRADAVLGDCAFTDWALSLQMGSLSHATEVIQGRRQNRCRPGETSAAQPPAEPSEATPRVAQGARR